MYFLHKKQKTHHVTHVARLPKPLQQPFLIIPPDHHRRPLPHIFRCIPHGRAESCRMHHREVALAVAECRRLFRRPRRDQDKRVPSLSSSPRIISRVPSVIRPSDVSSVPSMSLNIILHIFSFSILISPFPLPYVYLVFLTQQEIRNMHALDSLVISPDKFVGSQHIFRIVIPNFQKPLIFSLFRFF